MPESTPNTEAPLHITVTDQDGNPTSIADELERLKADNQYHILLYTYPNNFTPGCTLEARDFRDANPDIKKLGIQIIGLSANPAESHKKFSTELKLNFPLWSDPDRKLINALGAYGSKTLFGKTFEGTKRNTYLIDATGTIIYAWENVRATGHTERVFKKITTLLA